MIHEENTISVVLGPTDVQAEVRGEATLGRRDFATRLLGPVEISVDRLRESLAKLTGNLSAVLTDLKAVGGFELAEVQVAACQSGTLFTTRNGSGCAAVSRPRRGPDCRSPESQGDLRSAVSARSGRTFAEQLSCRNVLPSVASVPLCFQLFDGAPR